MTNDPTLHQTGRSGCWATCTCGWRSLMFVTTVGAHLEFGENLTTTHEAAPVAETRL